MTAIIGALSSPYLLGPLIGAAWLVGLLYGCAYCWAAGMESTADEMRREHNDWRGLPSSDPH